MEHLALEIFDLTGTGSRYASLPEDTSITITDTSEIFASGDVWSYSFALNVFANTHIFGSSGDMHGSRLHDQINKRKARLWVEDLPLYFGYLKLGENAEVDKEGNLDVSFESGKKTFDDMIEGAKANQVPMIGDVQIGMALWRKRWVRYRAKLTAYVDMYGWPLDGSVRHGSGEGDEWFEFTYDGESDENTAQQYPSMVYPKGRFTNWEAGKPAADGNYINTDYAYTEDANGTPSHPYCNVAVCYQKYGYEKRDKDGVVTIDYSSEPEAQRGYEYAPAGRLNSAPNFFVIYWIRALMTHLGIHIEENQMMEVEDLRRLFFVNTKCAYEEPKDLNGSNLARYGRYYRQEPERIIPEYINSKKNVDINESGFSGKNAHIVQHLHTWDTTDDDYKDKISIKITELEEWSEEDKSRYAVKNNTYYKAFASSECFPDVDISEVIKAIESGFGVRFLFSEDYQRVRIILLRNIYSSQEIQDIACDIVSDSREENCIRGFRMTYGDNKEDTHFYYKGFNDKLPNKKPYFVDNSDKHDYSKWDLRADYAEIINKVSAFDKTCYVTPCNGNAYGIKIDKDAKRYSDLHPSLFEYAGFIDAEDGDCTGDDETIQTVEVGFKPAIMNDLNMEDERNGSRSQRFALFVDDAMRPRRFNFEDGKEYDDPTVAYEPDRLYEEDAPTAHMKSDDGIVKPGEFAILSDMSVSYENAWTDIMSYKVYIDRVKFDIYGHINEGFRLYLQDNFEPNDDGVSPIEKHDWGLTLGIMRGSGKDAYVGYMTDTRDGEGNDTWDIVSGSSATAHPDTCDCYGAEWDYNGSFRVGPAEAEAALGEMFPDSDAPFANDEKGYITDICCFKCRDNAGIQEGATVLVATAYSKTGTELYWETIRHWMNYTVAQIIEMSRSGLHMFVEDNSSWERGSTLKQLCHIAYGGGMTPMWIDDGVGSRYGRFSLKLRAEKPNPYFNPKEEEGFGNRRYLQVENEDLRGRGLIDTFYKEHSYFIRNARIANRKVRMGIAQFLAVDKTKKVRVGDITGFIRKMQLTVSNKSGMELVTMEIMYI